MAWFSFSPDESIGKFADPFSGTETAESGFDSLRFSLRPYLLPVGSATIWVGAACWALTEKLMTVRPT